MPEPIIALREVYKAFRGRTIIQNATFEVASGEALALNGPNGSGKSRVAATHNQTVASRRRFCSD